MFDVSQTFVAHMWSHYKYETNAEEKKRLVSRYKNRYLRLVHSADGVTVVRQSMNREMKVCAGKGEVHGEGETDDEVIDNVQKKIKG